MADKDIKRELEANQQRDSDRERQEDDDGPVVDAAESMFAPLTRAIEPDDDIEPEEVDEQRKQNDEEQRPQ